jgi:signal peptidase I
MSKTKEPKQRTKGVVREYFELVAETAVFVFFIMTFVVQAFQIPSGSMEPTLLVGDFLLVNKLVYAPTVFPFEKLILPHRGLTRRDIIVFKYPQDLNKDFVKRVIGLPGEKVEVRDKQVYINDRPLEEKYKVHIYDQVYPRTEQDPNLAVRDNFGPVVVPPGHVFAMGDNRDNSMDSRYWGFVPMTFIKGRPWMIYFSYKAESLAYQKTSLRDRLSKILSFLPKARWRRMFKFIR